MSGSTEQTCFDSLFRPQWSCLSNGAPVSVVIDSLIWAQNSGVGKVVPGEQVVRLVGLIPPEVTSASKVTVLSASFLSAGPVVDLVLDDTSLVLAHQPLSADHVFNLVELCSGVGISSIGFSRAGFRHRCSVERQPKLAELHSLLHPGVPIVCADITHDTTASLVFAHCPDPCTIMSGIACQPFSRGGSQRGQQDSRSSSLPGTLRMMYLLQSPALIIECVVPARDNMYVRGHLQALVDQLGYHVVECSLRLENVWSACRYRWWVIATHPCIGPVKIPAFPTGSSLVVRDLMPYVHRWPSNDETQLLLQGPELERFQLGGQSLRQHQVRPDIKLPTALHSWGNQTQPCECECRPTGFSDELLTTKGLYAQLLQLPATEGQAGAWRHLHVLEVSLLNGVPLNLPWGSNQRLNLCAIGQMACPMHSIWLAASLARHMQMLFTDATPADPNELLQALKHEVMTQGRELFPNVPRQPIAPDRCAITIQEPGLSAWTLVFPPTAVVKDLILAHGRLHAIPLDEIWVKDDENNLTTHEAKLSLFPRLTIGKYEDLYPNDPSFGGAEMPQDAQDLNAATQMDLSSEHDVFENRPETIESRASDSGLLVPSSACPFDSTVNGLLDLRAPQLLAMLPPLVPDVELCSSMRRPTVPVGTRLSLLDNQAHAWADDEVWWHLSAIALPKPKETAVLDPLIAHTWLTAGTPAAVQYWASMQPRFSRIASVVLLDGHWTPCIWILRPTVLEVILWEHDDVDINGLNCLHGLLSSVLGLPHFHVSCTRRQFGEQNCGAAAITFLQHRLTGSNLPETAAQLQNAADELREAFRQSLEGFTQVPRPWCWGAGVTDAQAVLSALLQQHGVPSQAAPTRAKLVMQSIGQDAVKNALKGVAPWRTLKSLANQQKPSLQLVMPDELNAVMQERKTKKATPKASGPKVMPSKPMDIDPAKLTLADASFQMEAGAPAPQVAASQVGPLAVGVALMSFAEAKPFLQSGQTLTNKCLAILVINGPDELHTTLQWSSIRFAACCAVNNQPVLLSDHLVQLGVQPIVPVFTHGGPTVQDVPVACARITVFADQWPHDWSSLADHPFKQVLQTLPPLQTCRDDSCQCGKWHPTGSDSAQDALLDVFRWQFFTDAGRPTKHAQASHFSVQVRYLKSQELALLQLSGLHGVYLEPRLPDASAPTDEYQVVWLPQADFATAQHQSKCEPMSLGLARSGRRYGLRVTAKNFQQVFQKLKPEGQFLSPGTRLTWQCGPFPFGSDRKSIGRVFAEWAWQARPLQPARPIPGGVMWLVQSVTDPPHLVYNMQHGQVMISRCDSVREGMAEHGTVIGPQSTIELCSSTSTQDPWTVHDPWQQALTKMPAQPAPTMTPQLQELEERLERSIMEKLPMARMETDDTEDRLQTLEKQMQHLASRHQALEGTVAENHRQNSAQVQTLQAQMMSQMEVQRTHMSNMFEDQMSKLETILAKKGRFE